MCDVSLLCELTCTRLVALNSSEIILKTSCNHTVTLKFYEKIVRIKLIINDRKGRQNILSDMYCDLKNQESCINTSTVAGNIINEIWKWYIPHQVESGLKWTLKDNTHIHIIGKIIAAFCGIKIECKNTLSNAYKFSNAMLISFQRKNVLIVFKNKETRKIYLNGSGFFDQSAEGMMSNSEDGEFNWDVYVAKICHCIFVTTK